MNKIEIPTWLLHAMAQPPYSLFSSQESSANKLAENNFAWVDELLEEVPKQEKLVGKLPEKLGNGVMPGKGQA